MIKIFISHSHEDADIAAALIKLILNTVNIEKEIIRCSSLMGFGIEPGKEIDKHIRDEIRDAIFFLAIITPISLESYYVPYELGARWGMEKEIVPVVLDSKNSVILKGPISKFHSLFCDDKEQIRRFLVRISEEITGSPVLKLNHEAEIEKMTALAASPSKDSEGMAFKAEIKSLYKCLPAILSIPESTHILTIANRKTTPYLMHAGLRRELGRLSKAGLIQEIKDKDISRIADNKHFILTDYYLLTKIGNKYIKSAGGES